jgi:ABC-2 type transport system permease protein
VSRAGSRDILRCDRYEHHLMADATQTTVRTSEPPRLHPLARAREIWHFREILFNVVRKEVKVKYVSSVLGALWSMLNPAVYLVVFTIVFSFVLHNPTPFYPVFILSGLLAWNVFSASVNVATRSIIDNSNLVRKVYFPREVLPLSAIGASLVDFVMQGLVLIAFMLLFRYPFHPVNLLLFPLATADLLIFTAAICLLVSSLNVRHRDTQHFLNVLLLVWFWVTPIVYPSALIQQNAGHYGLFGIDLFHLYLLNPMADIVFGFQRALYGTASPIGANGQPTPVLINESVAWIAGLLGIVLLFSIVLLYVSWRLFFRLSGDFAEQL